MHVLHRVASIAAFTALAAVLPRAEAQTATNTCAPERGALNFLGCSVAQQLGPTARGASVSVVSLRSDRELPSPDALRQRVQTAIERALPGEEPSRSAAKLRLELSLEKIGGVLRVTADLRRASSFWQRARRVPPRAEQHAFVEVPLDAELRSLVPPPPLVVSSVLKLRAPERGIVALACGPFGPDGGQELAIVSRATIRVGRIAGGSFVERRKAAWAALSPVAPVPLREPLASAELTADGGLRVALSDRRDELELSTDLSVRQRKARAFAVPGGADAFAAFGTFAVGRDASSSKLIRLSGGAAVPSFVVGAQLATGDADSDGHLELAYSADTLEPDQDRLTLVTLASDTPKPRFELTAKAISAIAVCERREGPGMAPLVVASGDELWLIR